MDFSIVIEEDSKRDHPSQIAEKIAIAKRFGYRKIALNVKILTTSLANIPQPPNVPSNLGEESKFQILTRLTVKIDDSMQMHKLMKSDIQLKYDLLAIEIGNNEKLLNQFCGGHLNCDIVVLELTNPKMCFLLRKANLNLPCEKGIQFEISYRDLLSSQSIRINTISNARLLIEKCKGKNVIISSGAKYKLDFRSPLDVSSLGELFGMKQNLAKESVYRNATLAIKHSKIRKIPMSNVIDEEKGDSWLRQELKMGAGQFNKTDNKVSEATESLKRKDDQNQINFNKKSKLQI